VNVMSQNAPNDQSPQLELMDRTTRIVAATVLGICVTFPAIVLAVESGGAGHGDYVAARALFPIPMLLTHFTDDSITIASIVLAFIQFPVYGAVIAAQRKWKTVLKVAICVVSVHVITTAACFSGCLPSFS